ncbi:MAG: hypothetical protein JXQ73_08585 [Phycisphaerae bacterium]|nr:hypothetical protein [Phycisphaerae bacterium]
MAQTPNADTQEGPLRTLKYFKRLLPMLATLHDHAGERDKAHNRKLHFDQYTALILLSFCTLPVNATRR